MVQDRQPHHSFVISLGSNSSTPEYVHYALSRLREELSLQRETDLMHTEPIDFPYPSGKFWNVIISGNTHWDKARVTELLAELEHYAGRNRQRPELVPLDADLIIWDDCLLKPQDIKRPYFQPFLRHFNDE